MALNNRGGGPDLLSKFLQPNQNVNLEIAVAKEDDDVSRLSFNDNMSYICDLAMQKKNRKAMIEQEAFEETQELYEVAIGAGAEKTRELFKEIFTLVEAELLESYKEKDKLLEQRLEAAVIAEKERVMASAEPGPGQRQVAQIDTKIQKEETKILKKKIKKLRNMVKDIMKDKDAMKDEKKSKQLKRLQKKHDNLVNELEKMKSDSDTVTLGQSSTSLDLGSALGALGKGDDSDGEGEQRLKKKKTKPKRSKSTQSTDSGKIPKPDRVGRSKSDKPKSSKKKGRSRSKGPRPRSASPKGLAPIDEGSVKSEKKKKTIPRNTSKDSLKSSGKDSLKSSGTAETGRTTYTFKDFKKGRVDADVVNMSNWDEYLSESEFEKAFEMSRANFNALPHFKQTALKRELKSW
ncbi:unnamed protein product [Cylindrotheca closterium]|uniref:HP domain-containing protein n=1 Tax=Cylindrotheca closterium TaxID=2856 RepID=A0AAD2CHM5_9STRA|nr:unnamed protein product [Cylindrotheca closterium]